MQHDSEPNTVRIAHIFELTTSRTVADAFTRTHPDVQLIERAQDSVAQLRSLLDGLLDVAVLRITPQMLANHPTGWHHRLLRLEPMWLIGRPGDPARKTVSLHERPIEVFGDPPGSGLYNAHGDYLTAFENHTNLTMRWLGTPGAFSHCLTALTRATQPAYLFEFDSYATRYAAAGVPTHHPAEIQPHYPWSLAWRDEPLTAAVTDYLDIALHTARHHGWHHFSPNTPAPGWLPPNDPITPELQPSST